MEDDKQVINQNRNAAYDVTDVVVRVSSVI